MNFAIRQSSVNLPGGNAVAGHACPQCRQETLVLTRRHVSPPRLGASMITEYYDCDCCDARFQYSPAEDRWRPLYH
jgi:hypothetical protein